MPTPTQNARNISNAREGTTGFEGLTVGLPPVTVECALRVLIADPAQATAAARLADHPEIGRTGRILGTREVIPHKSYCLVYEIEQETVWVLALVHTARQWPPVA